MEMFLAKNFGEKLKCNDLRFFKMSFATFAKILDSTFLSGRCHNISI